MRRSVLAVKDKSAELSEKRFPTPVSHPMGARHEQLLDIHKRRRKRFAALIASVAIATQVTGYALYTFPVALLHLEPRPATIVFRTGQLVLALVLCCLLLARP